MKRLLALFMCLLLSMSFVCASSPAMASWIPNGVRVCGASNDQLYPFSVPDGVGGAILVWEDPRAAARQLYAQRVTGSGVVLWTAEGIRIPSPGIQRYPRIVSDGAGGAIVAWMDYRAGSTNSDIYAQRIAGNGAILWSSNGVPLCQALDHQRYPSIVPDGSGGAIVVWEDFREIGGTADIYAQRVSEDGSVQWTADGVVVCDAQLDQLAPWAEADGAGGAFVVWNDFRTGETGVFAQRIDGAGASLWTSDGVGVFAVITGEQFPWIVGDDTGGAFVVWTDSRGGEKDIFAQRIASDGSLAWDANSLSICSMGGDQANPVIARDGAGGAIVVWMDGRSSGWDVYAQRVGADGSPLWPHVGLPVCEGWPQQMYPVVASDEYGGAVVVWEDIVWGFSAANIYGQRLGPNGERMWPHEEPMDGTPICEADLDQTCPRVVSDASGGAIVAWQDSRSGEWDVYAQRVDAAGHTVVATLLQRSSAECSEGVVTILWTLAELDDGAEFRILRTDDGGDAFVEISSPAIGREGLSFRFVDDGVEPGSTYRYRIDVILGAERRELFTTDAVRVPALPLTLFQNHPNPFNPETAIPFYLPERGQIRLSVYDVRGALVRRLSDGIRDKGRHSDTWDGRDDAGRRVESGVYFCRLEAGKSVLTRTMVLVR